MGAYLSEPMTEKQSEDGEGNKIKYGASSMQGWRVSQEDSHNCVAEFDDKSSLFAVYDGHGGAEVAIYLSRHLPEVLKECAAYKNGEFVKALEECFLNIDASIKTPEVIKEIQMLAKCTNGDDEATVDYEEENVGALYEEATMPLDRLVAKYKAASEAEADAQEEDPACKPGSSKSLSAGSGSSSRSSISAEVGQSSASASLDAKVNGGNEAEAASSVGSTTDKQPCASEAEPTVGTSGSEEKLKTEGKNAENGCATTGESTIELSVEGKKIELKEAEESTKDKKLDGEIPEVTESLPAKSLNGDSVPDQSGNKNEEALAKSENEVATSTVNGSSKSDDVTSSSEVSSSAAAASSAETSPGSSTTETPRRKKVHPVPVAMESPKQERRSPRKTQQQSFECSDSDESDDEDDDDAGFNDSDSDSNSQDEGVSEEESSEDDEGEYEEDEDEDERFLSDVQEPGYDSGCTAVVCYMKWEADSLSVWVANAGDSRCVVCREGKAVDMSHDHKPESEVEAKRIVKAGGKVTEDGRVNGGLNLSRAIGDHSYKQTASLPPEEQMISPLPTVEHIVLNPTKDKFIVLACDGIWNSMSSQEVIDFVGGRLDKKKPLSNICEELFDACLAQDTCGDGTGCDNMTAIIVQLSGEGEVYSGSKRKLSTSDGDVLENPESTKKSRAE